MGSLLSRSVEIQVCNKTRKITLMNARTFFNCGGCSMSHGQELSPGSSGTWHFSGDPVHWGLLGTTSVSGILVYEAESFTLAIYFSNPDDYSQSSMEMGLELSPGKAHLDNLGATFSRMAHGTYSSSDRDIEFTRIIMDRSLETAQVSHGPLQVMATVFSDARSRIKVVLEEERRSW